MNLTSSKIISRWFQLVAVALLIVGCGTPKPKPVAWNLTITKPAPIEVDLVAVTAREKSRFESYPLDKYWSPNDEERKNADKLTSPPAEKWVVAKKDPKWKAWMGRRVVGLFIIANLPGNFEGGTDPRSEYLPLDKHHWDARKSTLEIEVKENRILVQTPEKVGQ
jgi:hypothetical protein